MGGRQLLDPRWHWLAATLKRLYDELDPNDTLVGMTIMAAGDSDMVSYSVAPGIPDIDKRVVANPSALIAAADATTVDANVEE